MEQLAVDVKEAAKATSLSVFTIRDFIRKGKLDFVRCGRRILIPVQVVRDLATKGLK